MAVIDSKNSSREFQPTMKTITRGSSRVPRKNINPRNSVALTAASPRTGKPAVGLLNWGRIIIMGTTARSWTMSIPSITRLERVPSNPWFIKVFRMTMVLETETRAPNQIEGIHSQPSQRPIREP